MDPFVCENFMIKKLEPVCINNNIEHSKIVQRIILKISTKNTVNLVNDDPLPFICQQL